MLKSFHLAPLILALSAFPAGDVWAQQRSFRMAGVGLAPEGISLAEEKPHFSIGGGNVLGAHRGEGSFRIVEGPVPVVDEQGNLIGFKATFTSGENGFVFRSRRGALATNYGEGPDDVPGVPGEVVLKILKAEPPVFLVQARFLANFEIDPERSTGQFKGSKGRWYMDARSAGPFRLDTSTGTSDPFRYVWWSLPRTGKIELP